MIDASLTRVYLESLSSGELLKLADRFNLDIPAGIERVFIVEALLENAFGDEDTNKTVDDMESDFLESAALPKQYNISFVDVMIRDPLWAFVFWEIKSHDREVFEGMPDFNGYCLKVLPMRDASVSKPAGEAEDSFIVPLDLHASGLYLNFPPLEPVEAEACYRIELCALNGRNPVPLAMSGSFKLPRLLAEPNQNSLLSTEFQELYRNPLACLSGARDFPVIRNADRLIRSRDLKKPSAVPNVS